MHAVAATYHLHLPLWLYNATAIRGGKPLVSQNGLVYDLTRERVSSSQLKRSIQPYMVGLKSTDNSLTQLIITAYIRQV